MAMKFFNGRNLFQLKQDEESHKIKIDTDKRLRIMRAILSYVEGLHQAGVIHRDLKSENIIIDPEQESVHPVDFSHCKFMNDTSSCPGPFVTMVFSPHEQFYELFDYSHQYDERSDNYTLGKVLAEWLGATTLADKVVEPLEKLKDDDIKSTRKAMYQVYQTYSQSDTVFYFSHFKQGDLSEEHADSIKHMLQELTLAEINSRLDLKTAIGMIDQIIEERQPPSPTCKR